MAKTVRDNVVELFGERDDDIPEMPLESAPPPSARPVASTGSAAVDLTEKPKIIFLMGPGSAGKSTLGRWICERALDRGESSLVLATMDARRPTLKQFFPQRALVPKSLERLLSRLIEARRSAVIDMGGDMTLSEMLNQVPDLQAVMTDAGIEPVAFYLLTPRSADLTLLKAMEDEGFRPTATALVLNMGTMSTKDPVQEFARIRKHSVYRAALERGAIEVWLPLLHAAHQLEEGVLGFQQATNNGGSLGVIERRQVSRWLGEMELSFAACSSWLP